MYRGLKSDLSRWLSHMRAGKVGCRARSELPRHRKCWFVVPHESKELYTSRSKMQCRTHRGGHAGSAVPPSTLPSQGPKKLMNDESGPHTRFYGVALCVNHNHDVPPHADRPLLFIEARFSTQFRHHAWRNQPANLPTNPKATTVRLCRCFWFHTPPRANSKALRSTFLLRNHDIQ
jgi:hypothetical protein